MSRAQRFLHGVGVGYVLQGVVLLCSLWLTRFVLSRLGQEEYGGWLVALQVLAYLDLLDLGVVGLLPREVAYATGRAGNTQSLASAAAPVVARIRRLVFLQMPLVGLIAAGVWWFLQAKAAADAGVLGIIGLTYVLLFPFRLYAATLQGFQDLAFLGWLRIGLWLGQAGATVLCVYAGLEIWSLAIGWMVQQVLMPMGCWLRLRIAFPGATSGWSAALPPGETSAYLTRGMWVTVNSVAHILLNGTEIILVQMVMGPSAVVVYVCSAKLVTILGQQVFSLVLTAEPALSELHATGRSEHLVRVSAALRQMVLLTSGLLACLIFSCNEGFVTWWVGGDRYAGTAVTLWLLAAMVLRHFAFAFLFVLFCRGHEQRNLSGIALVDGVVTLVGGWLLIPHLGLLGVPIASFLGVILVGLPAALYLFVQDLQTSVYAILRSHLGWSWRFAALMLAIAASGLIWEPRGLVSLVVTGTLTSVAYAIVMFPPLIDSPLWPYVEPRLTRWWPRSRKHHASPSTAALAEAQSTGV